MRPVLASAVAACVAACATVPPGPGPEAVATVAIAPAAAAASAAVPGPHAEPSLRASLPRPASPVVVRLDDGALSRVPARVLQVSFDAQAVACRVVAVHRLLEDAGVLPAAAGDARYVLAISGDGRRVLFSLAELDPRIGGRGVVVTRDCGPEDAGRARRPRVLLALDDAAPARRLEGVTALVVVIAP